MGKKTPTLADLDHARAMADAAKMTQLEKENAMLREILANADQATQALAALLNLAAVDRLKIGNWYVYRTCNGTAEAIYKDGLDPEPDGRIPSVAYALRHRADGEVQHVISRGKRLTGRK